MFIFSGANANGKRQAVQQHKLIFVIKTQEQEPYFTIYTFGRGAKWCALPDFFIIIIFHMLLFLLSFFFWPTRCCHGCRLIELPLFNIYYCKCIIFDIVPGYGDTICTVVRSAHHTSGGSGVVRMCCVYLLFSWLSQRSKSNGYTQVDIWNWIETPVSRKTFLIQLNMRNYEGWLVEPPCGLMFSHWL